MSDRNPSADAIIATLRANAGALRARGIIHAALFGSRARGDNKSDSNIDILIETQPDAVEDLFAYAGVEACVAALFPVPVDVINRAFLKPSIRPVAETDVIHAF